MSLTVNHVTIAGNLVRDVEVKDVGDTKVASFTVAVNERFKNKAGEAKEKTAFIAVSAWGPLATSCATYLAKGSGVLVEGKLEQETWDDKNGGKREKTKVRALNVQFIGPKKEPAAKAADPDDWN
jgi:single-strand DNA-binding protein